MIVSAHPTHDYVSPAFDLVNSDHGRGLGLPDVLEDGEWLSGYLRRWHFDPAGRPSAGDLDRLRELRSLLRRVVDRLAGGGKQLTPNERRDLDRFMGVLSYRRRLAGSAGSLVLVPDRRDWDWVVAEIAASFAETLTDVGAERIKVCANPDCRFAFYDVTKNRSRRWCDHRTCGNRMKVRRFRARKRERRR